MTSPTMHALFDGSDHGLIPGLAERLDATLGTVAAFDAWECVGDGLRCVDGNGCECEMFGQECPPAHEAALGLLRDHGPALRALLAEHEALLRRVADAPVAVAGAAPGRFYYAGADTIEHGQRVRILAEPGEVGS